MKKLLLATVLLALACPAHSADHPKLPTEALGVWCMKKAGKPVSTYVRGNCWRKDEYAIAIGSDNYKGWEMDCKMVKIVAGKDSYTMEYRCAGEAFTWSESVTVKMPDFNTLVMVLNKTWGEKRDD